MTPLTEAEVAELETLVANDSPRVLMLATATATEGGQLNYGIMRHLGGDRIRCEATMLNEPLGKVLVALRNAAPQLLAAWRESQAKDAEISRLRAALEKIDQKGMASSRSWITDIARTALAKEGE